MNGTNRHGSLHLVELVLDRVEDDGSDVGAYRKRTVAMLRRYFRAALYLGRTPSVLGGQMFRARVTSYRMHTFEDIAIFVHDMESCLEELDKVSLEMLAATVLMEYSLGDSAKVLGITERHAKRLYPMALDRLTRILLEKQLMDAMAGMAPEEEDEELPPKKPAVSERATAATELLGC